jgi:phosphohistidine swiveling domain-containing protein
MLSVSEPFTGCIATSPEKLGDVEGGAILLVSALKPQLVGLFGSVRGVITEAGGYLSHAAIVAREVGIPILVLDHASQRLTQGTPVKVSASGEVQIVGFGHTKDRSAAGSKLLQGGRSGCGSDPEQRFAFGEVARRGRG